MNLIFSHPPSLPEYVYIHYPLCRHHCSYCDFNVYRVSDHTQDFDEQWLGALRAHLRYFKGVCSERLLPLKTLYLGGGTPSLLSAASVEKLLGIFQMGGVEISSDAELTMECNPESLTEDKVRDLKSLGINRISLGVQSFQDVQLRRLERLSTRNHLHKAIEWIASQFENFSLDLMVGLPDQSQELFQKDLDEMLRVNPPHISAYILTLKDDHVWKTAPSMKDRMIEDEQVEGFYLRLIEQLRSAGFRQYEVSNFARPGFESRHNSNYWDVKSSYLGLGPGAHGYFEKLRYECVRDPKAWMSSLSGIASFEQLTTEQQKLEEFYMMLRTRRPANIADFRSAAIIALQQSGHIILNQKQGTFTLSDRGWLLMESVAERLLAQ